MAADQVKVNANLPSDIIESNILSRVPVKTLVRFRAVQKSWYSLISSDPFFINKHMHHQLQNNNSNLLLMKLNDDSIVVGDTSSKTVRKFTHNRFVFHVVASLNGIVCLYGEGGVGTLEDECICLFNPSLGIAKFVGYRDLVDPLVRLCVGFGFHKRTNDYKVVMFDNPNGRDGGVKGVEIYSLSSDSWRTVKTDLLQLRFYTHRRGCEVGVYVNDNDQLDAYCWLAIQKDDNGSFYAIHIISFDMRDEVFKEIKAPPTGCTRFGTETCLFNYKESLAVLVQCGDSAFLFYVWVMKGLDSWTKLGKFDGRGCDTFLGIIQETRLVMKSCFQDEVKGFNIDKLETNTSSTKDNRILLKARSKDNKARSKGKNILLKARSVTSYTESLVLLDADKYMSNRNPEGWPISNPEIWPNDRRVLFVRKKKNKKIV